MFEILYSKLEIPLSEVVTFPTFDTINEAENWTERASSIKTNTVFAIVDTQLIEPEFVYLNGVKYERVKEI